MFRKIVTAIIVVPLLIVVVGFAVANRQPVTVSFDPFDQAHPAYALTLPLFVVIFILAILGVIVGGAAAWLRQAYWRRRSRRLDAELHSLRAEIEAMRASFAQPARTSPAQQPEPRTPPLILPPIS